MFDFTDYKALSRELKSDYELSKASCLELQTDADYYKALSRELKSDYELSRASCLELQGMIDGVTHENTALSAQLRTQKISIEHQKKALEDYQSWTKELETLNKELSTTLSTWRSKAKIALDNYTRELEKC